MNKLWLLKRIVSGNEGPWCFGGYGIHQGFVIRAKSEPYARELADRESKDDENYTEFRPWLSIVHTSCTEITGKGKMEVLLCDYLADH